jgi:hypothetical protein
MQSTAIVAVLVVGCARGAFGQLTSPPPGSSNFGTWFTDEQNLPAYRYSGHPNASILPKDTAPLEPVIAHQVGNDRVVGVAYTDGSVSVRQVSIAVILCSVRGIRRILLGHLSTVHAQGSSHDCALSIAHFFSLVNHSSTTNTQHASECQIYPCTLINHSSHRTHYNHTAGTPLSHTSVHAYS